MVISQIRSLYRDANDLLHTVTKRVYEAWNPALEQWQLRKIAFLFPDTDLPFHADRPEASVEHQHGWIVPPEWEFVRKSGNTSASRRVRSGMCTRMRLRL